MRVVRQAVNTVAILTVILALAAGMVGGVRGAAAANGYEQWTGPFSDGCFYYWDGYAYTGAGCPRGDGGFDFYVDGGAGQWAFVMSTGWMADGSVWVYYDGAYYIGPATSEQSVLYPTTATIGAPTWSGMAGNVIVDQIMINANNALIDTILAPSCAYWVGNTCYYS